MRIGIYPNVYLCWKHNLQGSFHKKMDLTKEVEGRHIILMEDIVDTGNTTRKSIRIF